MTTKRKKGSPVGEIKLADPVNPHDSIHTIQEAYYQLEEGDFLYYTGPTGPASTWMFDRGYLCSLNRPTPLAIWYTDRRIHFGQFSIRDGLIKSSALPTGIDPYTNVIEIITEVERKMQKLGLK